MIEPYYSDDFVTIYHGDCKEILPGLSFDVVVTDPPYGISYVSNMALDGPSKPIHGDDTTDLRDYVIKAADGKPMLIFGTWKMPRPAETRELLIWHKNNVGPGMGDLSLPWGPAHEEIYVIGEGWTGKRRSNVYSVKGYSAGAKERPDHPTPKPVFLMRELVERSPQGVILDPFMGSGSTLRAAKDLGRKAIGIEIDEQYCETAVKRLAQEVLFA